MITFFIVQGVKNYELRVENYELRDTGYSLFLFYRKGHKGRL